MKGHQEQNGRDGETRRGVRWMVALFAGLGILTGSGGGWAWSADDLVRIGEVPAGTIRLGKTHPNAIRLGEKAPGTIALGEQRPGTILLGPRESGVRKNLNELYYSVVYYSNDERAKGPVFFKPPPPFEDLEQNFELRNGTILKKAHFQRLPDGWFRIQHQTGLGNYHIREFSEKDQMTLSVWRAQEISNWDWNPENLQSLGAVALNQRKLNFILIPEIELVDARLEDLIRFLESYSAESDPGRKGMKFEMNVWDPQQSVSVPVLRYVSLNQLLKLIAQKTGTVIEIGAESVILRDPSKVLSQGAAEKE